VRSKVKIVEQYLEYSPPVQVYGSVTLLMRYIPEKYLEGIQKIVLTNSASLRSSYKGKYSAGDRRIRPTEARGMYWSGHIFLVMDHILGEYPEVFLLLPIVKTYAIGKVLYHEVGHHIHKSEQPGYRDNKEVVADEWREKLLTDFMSKRYWYLAGVVRLYAKLIHPVMLKATRRPKEENVECESGPA
jgi:hypothetical protein